MMSSSSNKTEIWVEKYRPTNFNDIVLSPINHTLFKNIINMNYFPNLLFYGPPGTGKTTTIINLINKYQQKYSKINTSTVIHLNASDERGIDTIRNQINQFVKSSNLFEKGLKFVILDEVDYMTKNAQQALKYILQSNVINVRFCLICNYISKIDESLKNEFICVRFNQLPDNYIIQFIKTIAEKENIMIDVETIKSIQKIYGSDIRSMINFIQLNQNLQLNDWEDNIITDDVFKDMHEFMKKGDIIDDSITRDTNIIRYTHNVSVQYNIDKRTLLLKYFNWILRNCKSIVTEDFLDKLQNIIQDTSDVPIDVIISYISCYIVPSINQS